MVDTRLAGVVLAAMAAACNHPHPHQQSDAVAFGYAKHQDGSVSFAVEFTPGAWKAIRSETESKQMPTILSAVALLMVDANIQAEHCHFIGHKALKDGTERIEGKCLLVGATGDRGT